MKLGQLKGLRRRFEKVKKVACVFKCNAPSSSAAAAASSSSSSSSSSTHPILNVKFRDRLQHDEHRGQQNHGHDDRHHHFRASGTGRLIQGFPCQRTSLFQQSESCDRFDKNTEPQTTVTKGHAGGTVASRTRERRSKADNHPFNDMQLAYLLTFSKQGFSNSV